MEQLVEITESTFGLCSRENVSTLASVIRGWIISKSVVFPMPGNFRKRLDDHLPIDMAEKIPVLSASLDLMTSNVTSNSKI